MKIYTYINIGIERRIFHRTFQWLKRVLFICNEYIFFMQIKKNKSAEIAIHKRESKRN